MNIIKYITLIISCMFMDALLAGLLLTPFSLSIIPYLTLLWLPVPRSLLIISGFTILLQGPYFNIPAFIGILFLIIAYLSARLLYKVMHPISIIRFIFAFLFILLYYNLGPGIPHTVLWWISTSGLLYGIMKYA